MKKAWKILGLGLASVALCALLLFVAASVKARARLERQFDTHRIVLPVPPSSDTAAIERGRHLVEARYGCNGCHGADLGGGVMIEDPAIGSIRGPNLTAGRGSLTTHYSMADWDRIVRHGV